MFGSGLSQPHAPSTTYMPRPELPPHLQSLFNPRPPLPFMKVPVKPKCRDYSGLSDYIDHFEEQKPPPRAVPLPEQPRTSAAPRANQQCDASQYDASKYEMSSDPFKTLFVCRLNYETTERRLQREFEMYGPIKSVVVPKDLQGKSRGYAFIEFANEVDFKNAYKHADSKVVDGRRLVVDYERGRSDSGWLPRRFGGGFGDTRAAKPKKVRTPKVSKKPTEDSRPNTHDSKRPKPRPRSRSPRRRMDNNPRNRRPPPRNDRNRHYDSRYRNHQRSDHRHRPYH